MQPEPGERQRVRIGIKDHRARNAAQYRTRGMSMNLHRAALDGTDVDHSYTGAVDSEHSAGVNKKKGRACFKKDELPLVGVACEDPV